MAQKKVKPNPEISNPNEELKKWVGPAPEFIVAGKRNLHGFIKYGNLKSNESFLDVGCGSGRMAIPLTQYLKDGNYEGFDINLNVIKWCKENIESKYPNFHFQFVNVENRHYNKNGILQSEDFKFPYDSESFDFVCLTSVFTHLLPTAVQNYLKEITRVLKKNGRCYITYFLLNENSKNRIHSGLTQMKFVHKFENFYSKFETNPERAIAYEEEFVKKLYQKFHLTIQEPIFYGSWSGIKNAEFGQDIIISHK